MVLLIDNYDSFVYNLYQYIGELQPNITVVRNDEITIELIQDLQPSHIVLSPGPGHPKDSNICLDIIKHLGPIYPILGVCLGHQAIGYVYGETITYAKEVLHGKTDTILINANDPIFSGYENLEVARYHSLVIDPTRSGNQLDVLATSSDGEIMAVKHKIYNTYGLQFHPESILTKNGKQLLKNFLKVGRQ